MDDRTGARVTKAEALFAAALTVMLVGTGALLMPVAPDAASGSPLASSSAP